MADDESVIRAPALDAGTPEISMAPLIDVVFLLLIFFMVTTVFPDNRALIIEKPESQQSQSIDQARIEFVVDKAGGIFYQDKTLTANDVKRLIKEQLGSHADASVLLKVDRKTPTQELIRVMDACKAGGASRVGIATQAHAGDS